MNNDDTITPIQKDAFTITFDDEKITGTTDCNSFFGTYKTDKNNLEFGPLGSTKKFCMDSQESEFIKYLTESSSYMFDQGNLILLLKFDSGSFIFEPLK